MIKVEDLRLSFTTRHRTIHSICGVNFEIFPNEVVGLIGESGSGKSLTAQALLQLWPHSPHHRSGKIFYQGQDLLALDERSLQKIRGREISMVFQDPASALNPTMKIGLQLTEGFRHHHPISKNEAYQRGIEWLKKVGISDPELRMKQYPHELSGGMKQRIMIAMAMMCQPALLIADEPTTALDVTLQAQILELFKMLRQEHQTSLLFITHDLGVVARCCDRVLVMQAGQIVETASVDQLFSTPQHPYTLSLLKSKRSLLEGSKELFTGRIS